jgi:hypothetical protein
MVQASFESFLALIQNNGVSESVVINAIAKTVPKLQTRKQYEMTLQGLQSLPKALFLSRFELAKSYADVLCTLDALEDLELFLYSIATCFQAEQVAQIQLEYATALQIRNQHQLASEILKEIVQILKGRNLGIAWVRLGYSLFELQLPWESAFEEGIPLLEGLELARGLINLGVCLSQKGRNQEAHAAWIDAIPLVKHRVKTHSFVLHNLATSMQRLLDPKAERYWLELERVTRNPIAAERHASALNGIGVQRRMYGEWFRAEAAYLAAKKNALGVDLLTAIWGLSRVYLLSNKPQKALAVLEDALQNPALAKNQLHAAKASALLALNDLHGTKENLALAGDIQLESVRWLLAFAKAELARREGREADALRHLQNLPVTHLHPREEAGRHPELCHLLRRHGLPAPEPLPYRQGIVVKVNATGFLAVSVNDREVDVSPLGKTAELLVFLLEQNLKASASDLEMSLYLEADDARKRLGDVAKRLKTLLGWQDSIKYNKSTKEFCLDPTVVWQYDIAQARADGVFEGEFLAGIETEWVNHTRKNLKALQ